MSELERVLELQDIDTAIDQIVHRRARLPERATSEAVAAAHAAMLAERDRTSAELAAAEARIEALEHEGTARGAKRARLAAQLTNASTTRMADALTAEISTLDDERSVADDEELGLMDVVESAAARLDALATELDTSAAVVAARAAELEAAEAALAAEHDELQVRRVAAVAAITPASLTRYDQGRKSFGGVAIARLHGDRCGACHLDQSRAGLDHLRHAPDDALVECEQCGRLLVR